MIKSHPYKVQINKCKRHVIENIIYPEWKKVAGVLMNRHVNYFFENAKVHDGNKLYQQVSNTFLSERYKDCINRQVVGMLKSKLTNFKKKFVRIVMNNDSLSNEQKKQLCFISKYNLYFLREEYVSKNITISKENLKLSRWIFKSFVGNFPSCKHINMTLQDKVALIEPVKSANKDEVSCVIKFSTHIKRKPIYLPILKNKYADEFVGKLSSSCSMEFDRKGKLICVRMTKEAIKVKDEETCEESQVKSQTKPQGEVIGTDIGLCSLIVLSNGEMYGMRFLRQLKRFDNNLLKITNQLKEEHGKYVKLTGFDSYNNLNHRIKQYIKNEVGRIINKILTKHNIQTLVIEDLDFTSSKLSRKMNRLLHRFGLGVIKNKLEAVKLCTISAVKYVNAAYGSQTCSTCGYVDEKNRPTQSEFKCRCCGKKEHADVNASRTNKIFFERFGEKKFYGKSGRSEKLKSLVERFINNKRFWVNNESVIQAMMKNPYFRGHNSELQLKMAHLC